MVVKVVVKWTGVEMVSPSIKLPSDKGKAASVDPVAPFPIKPRGCYTKVAGRRERG